MIAGTGSLHWQLHAPPGDSEPAWLGELSEMRGRVLYADGRRPAFRQADGRFADVDPLDGFAYHLLARNPAGLAGCIRLLPLAESPACVTERVLGPERFQELLREIGTPVVRMSEASRWAVAPGQRRSTVGMRLIAGMWLVCRHLGHRVTIGLAGRREGQDQLLIRTGARPLDSIPPFALPQFADELQVLCFDLWKPAPTFETVMARMAEDLDVEQQLGRAVVAT